MFPEEIFKLLCIVILNLVTIFTQNVFKADILNIYVRN